MSVCVASPLNVSYAANAMPIVTQPMTFAPVPPRKRKIAAVNSENVLRNVAQRPFSLEPDLPAAPAIQQTLTAALVVPAKSTTPELPMPASAGAMTAVSAAPTAAVAVTAASSAAPPRARRVCWSTPLAEFREIAFEDLATKDLFTPYESVMASVMEVKKERMLGIDPLKAP